MARPMMLIQESLLAELYNKYKDGVKYNTLIRNYELPFSGPTLRKLIRYYSIIQNTDPAVSDTIYESLFPSWLTEEIQCQDANEWVYRGTMPLGKWEQREKV